VPENLANTTIRRIREALDSGRSAGVPEIIRLIQELSSKAFTITVKELSDLISQDVAISAKVISAANTMGYNPMGIPVSTISQAIQVIGFNRIRNLAISLLLMENAEQSMSSQEQRQSSAIALTSGLIARAIMEESGKNDPELAFVCASLRNYGRLLMTTFLIEDYRDALTLAEKLGDDMAYKRIFGLTPLELGYHLMLSAHLPKPILRSLQAVPEEIIQMGAQTPEDELLILADFSANLCAVMTDAELNADHFNLRVSEVCQRYGNNIKIKSSDIEDLMSRVNSELSHYGRQYGLKSMSNFVLRCVEARARKKDPPPDPIREEQRKRAGEAIKVGADGSSVAPARRKTVEGIKDRDLLRDAEEEQRRKPAREDDDTDKDYFLEGIQALTDRIASPPVEMGEIYPIVIKTLTRALKLKDCILFLKVDDEGNYLPQYGDGDLLKQIRSRKLVGLRKKDVFGISLSRKEDVLIENAYDPKIKPYVPDWLRHLSNINSFILLPVHDGGVPFALICGGLHGREPLRLGTKELRQLKAMRIHLVTAFRLDKQKKS